MGFVETAAGTRLTSRTPAVALRVKRRISTIAFAFNAKIAAGKMVVGQAGARFRGGPRVLGRQVSAQGSVLLRRSPSVRVRMRVTQLQLARLAGPTRARLTLRVVATHGLAGCRLGSRATLQLFNSHDLRQDDSSDANLRLSLPSRCGGTIKRAAAISVTDS
jgi:hypothetical protein